MDKITMPERGNLTLINGWNHYARHCKVKNLAEVTMLSYKQGFDNIVEYFGEKFLITDIKNEHLEFLILYLKRKNTMNDITINTRLRSNSCKILYILLRYLTVAEVHCGEITVEN